MTKKKHALFIRKRIVYVMKKAFDDMESETSNGNKIATFECEGLSDYCRAVPPRRWYSVTNHSRKNLRRKCNAKKSSN